MGRLLAMSCNTMSCDNQAGLAVAPASHAISEASKPVGKTEGKASLNRLTYWQFFVH